MAAEVCQAGAPLASGRPAGWAAGVIQVVGQIDFLNDPSQSPHRRTDDLARGVSPATLHAKARIVRELVDVQGPMDPQWTRADRMADKPLAWLLQTTDGLVIDIRTQPRAAGRKPCGSG